MPIPVSSCFSQCLLGVALLYYKRACQLVPDIDFKLNIEDPPQSEDSDSECSSLYWMH